MQIKPTVSIIVPCYNQAQYLPDALQSVLDQTYGHWECIIVNDGSPDNTEEVAAKWLLKDERFKYLKKDNGGLSSARNAGIRASKGEYILPLDADDKIGSEYLKLGVETLDRDDEVRIVYADAEYFGAKEGMWELPDYTLERLALKNIIYCSALFRRRDFDKSGPYDESFQYGREDWDIWLSILKDGGKVVKVKYIGFFYRKHNKESMVDKIIIPEIDQKTKMSIFLKHQEMYITLFGDPVNAYFERDLYKNAVARLKRSRFYRVSNFIHRRIFG